jgi:outer membrane immunogenic protein
MRAFKLPKVTHMRKILLLTASLISSANALSAETTDTYIGASYNSFSIDFNSAIVDDTEGPGLLVGLEFGENWAFEAEYLNSGKADMDYQLGAIDTAKIKVQSLAVYGAYRSSGQLYLKGRVGIVSNNVDITDIQCSGSFCINSLFDDGAGFALGLGGGFVISEGLKIEAEYKLLNKDIRNAGAGLIVAF